MHSWTQYGQNGKSEGWLDLRCVKESVYDDSMVA